MHPYFYWIRDVVVFVVVVVRKRPVLSLLAHLKSMCFVPVVTFNSHVNLTVVHIETDVKLFAVVE
jgi:hypothetical protein